MDEPKGWSIPVKCAILGFQLKLLVLIIGVVAAVGGHGSGLILYVSSTPSGVVCEALEFVVGGDDFGKGGTRIGIFLGLALASWTCMGWAVGCIRQNRSSKARVVFLVVALFYFIATGFAFIGGGLGYSQGIDAWIPLCQIAVGTGLTIYWLRLRSRAK
ncbi:MAG: hypothetical protein HN909_08860 [Phycisphaerales bacterium]|nr:hypothetical protein [Phycisphaerales bacterium]MBT7171860.1 hypothetical protein [Phycisphaerales bacterium]